MQHISLILMMVYMIDFHLNLKLTVIECTMGIIYSFVFAINQTVVRNIGIIIFIKTIALILSQEQSPIIVIRRLFILIVK
jgi:hypothetical protein